MNSAADLVLAALRDAVPSAVKVYDSIIPGVPSERYVVAYIPAGWRTASSVDAASDHVYLEFQTTTVASDNNPAYSAAYCRWLATAVRDALTDLEITADGWGRARIKHEGSQSPRPDETTSDKKVYATDQFSLETVRL